MKILKERSFFGMNGRTKIENNHSHSFRGSVLMNLFCLIQSLWMKRPGTIQTYFRIPFLKTTCPTLFCTSKIISFSFEEA